ncbi:MAG: replication-associated recombination protein A [Elusimicrobiota bacterium]
MKSLTNIVAPKGIEEFVGQKHLLSEGKFLRKSVDSGIIKSCLFFGPSGSGKTVLANIIADKIKAKVFRLNAVTSGVAEFKKITDYAKSLFEKEMVLVILDEIHHFNKTQQDVLLPSIEKDELIVIGITTENPFFYINKALLSRFLIFEFKKHTKEDLSNILDNSIKKAYGGKIELTDKAREIIINYSDGDARRLLNFLESCVLISRNNLIDEDLIKDFLQNRYVYYDKKDDNHYDIISAFIKSMRGSDPDAALYWLGKMLYAGEDPLFIARRILIAASEDVGLANSMALVVAQSAFEAVKNIGMPEARIILSHAALYVALSPKSNSAYLAIDRAMDEVKNGKEREVPIHLKDSHLDSDFLGDGKGYKYPHDYPHHYVEQVYMTEPKKFYEPSGEGLEPKLNEYLKKAKNEKKT